MELEVEPSVVVFTALALLVAAAVLFRRRRKAASDDGPTSGCLAAQLQVGNPLNFITLICCLCNVHINHRKSDV